MTENIYDFPDRCVIEEEAGAWLVRLDGDTQLSTEETGQLREWLSRSPLHREELGNLLNFYHRMNVLTELSVPLGNTRSDKAKRSPSAFRDNGPVGFVFGRMGLGFAAAILVICAGVLLFVSKQEVSDLSYSGLYSTAIGEQTAITLADGSVLQLNTNSQARVKYEEAARNVKLMRGEAYFKVSRDVKRPFYVYAGKGRIEAVGTEFSVRLGENETEIAVAEGRVMIVALENSSGNETVSNSFDAIPENFNTTTLGILDAGQSTTIRATISDERNTSTDKIELVQDMEGQEVYRRLSWREGLLMFSGDPLEEVIREISRYSPILIEILDPELRTIRVGGQFRIGDVEAMLTSLETNFNIRIIRLRQDHIQLAAADKQ